ncbi:MAG: endopeptidase La [Desulfobacteraceae bacterium]|nr:endopeptidase La [Desulfobacteraceae bacterium]MBC2755327.1 endopeptidase La [Desulfobacteraceae bacterium]
MNQKQQTESFANEKIPEILPILPLFDVVMFPKMVLPLIVLQKESIQLIDEAMSKNRIIGTVASKFTDPKTNYTSDDLYTIGSSAVILKMAKMDEDKAQLLLQGLGRFKITDYTSEKPYFQARISELENPWVKDKKIEALMANLINQYQRIVELSTGLPHEIASMAKSLEEPDILADMITSTINSTTKEKQEILETLDIKERLKKVTKMVNYQLEILEMGNKIQTQVKGDMDKQQREYYLRQQLKAIREELGETDDSNVEIEDYRTKIAEKDLPEMVKKEAERELNRLSRMHASSAEYTVALTYLDWITELPWNEGSEDNLDLVKAQKILDSDHYGLDKAKKRILEYLAVRKLNPNIKGPILCLVGPPGTGKTSLGHSVANALGRNFIRIALGGIRDEAEVRGHRRTYVGALPGRIIQGIRRAGSNNPVFMLDEIDKVGSDFRGDPSSALLEVLDPEQNFSFEDHYLDVPFDLSQVMFITTANVIDTIPPALRDRMEVLRLSGYTLEEKIKIASRYLIPRQREANGLKSEHISFTKGAIKQIISGYTLEAGLRNLEREIGNVCRGVAASIAKGEKESVDINTKNLTKYLGPVRITNEMKKRVATPGVVMGLAWTEAGGDILFIEATSMRGNGKLTLTGQLGDVMKESATAALSYIRSNAASIGIEDDYFQTHDIHIHVPAGAIPKDGPSAGVTMLTAITSVLTGTTTHKDLAMTGEITLRGQVMPVGGIKEKVLAAHRSGIKTIIMPKLCEKDLLDVPKKVKTAIKFHFADNMKDVLKIALNQ